MRVSKTGKALCSRCRRLATGEGNVHRDHRRLAVLVYCDEHAKSVGDVQPLGYYRQFFTPIDDMCERENVHQMQWCNHPMTNERLFFAYVACSLLHEYKWSLDDVRRWLHSIAGQPGCITFTSSFLSAQERRSAETAVSDGFYQKSANHLPEPIPDAHKLLDLDTSESGSLAEQRANASIWGY